MSFALIFRIQGFLLIMTGLSMCVPPLVGLAYGQKDQQHFVLSIAITLLCGLTLTFCLPRTRKNISQREGFLIVSLGWMLASLFGCLPFLFDGTCATLTDAYFETVSGFTTTGSTILKKIEGLPLSTLFWRKRRHELACYLTKLELQDDTDYWKTVRERVNSSHVRRYAVVSHIQDKPRRPVSGSHQS